MGCPAARGLTPSPNPLASQRIRRFLQGTENLQCGSKRVAIRNSIVPDLAVVQLNKPRAAQLVTLRFGIRSDLHWLLSR